MLAPLKVANGAGLWPVPFFLKTFRFDDRPLGLSLIFATFYVPLANKGTVLWDCSLT